MIHLRLEIGCNRYEKCQSLPADFIRYMMTIRAGPKAPYTQQNTTHNTELMLKGCRTQDMMMYQGHCGLSMIAAQIKDRRSVSSDVSHKGFDIRIFRHQEKLVAFFSESYVRVLEISNFAKGEPFCTGHRRWKHRFPSRTV